ncbi:MAG TPA: FecR domain-containing protein [Terracidiphilus sp.]|nr:FecR domain-containing protein [Terracidiphilus sp.]
MSDEYLWNGEGQPDAETARLERVLRPLRYEPKPFDLAPVARVKQARRPSWLVWAAVAAAAIVAVSAGWRVWIARTPAVSTWRVSWNGASSQSVREGELIATGKGSAARLQSDFVGEVELEPESRLRVVESTRDEQRLALQRGTMHAFIWAPPREFVVDTPGATTVDLGCAYTLHVAPDGTGLLTVKMGWVAFQWREQESFIPAGAACATKPGRGPGTPHFTDARPEFQAKLAQFDGDGDAAALAGVLADARPRDALTLWHLLGRTRGEERAEVFDRFSKLVKLPPDVTRAKILADDESAMDASWNALGFGNTDWWRGWKRRW